MPQFKAWVTDDNNTYATNGLEFDTVEEAELYAKDLFSRWLGALDWAVLPISPENVGHIPAADIAERAVSTRK